jgi:hypothetical protein
MASSSKPTGVHYALVFFVLLSIVSGLGWLLAYKGSNSIGELRTQNEKLKKDASSADAGLRKSLDQIALIKKLLGSGFDEVGEDTQNAVSVAGDMALHIKNYGQGVASQTYNDTVVKLFEALRNASQQRDKLQEQLAVEVAQFEQLKSELNAQLAAEKTSRETADKSKIDADNTHQEELAKREADISELKKAIASTQQEFDEYKEAMEKQAKQLEQRVQGLVGINNKLTRELEEKTRSIIDRADGAIAWVDPSSRKIWVNLGEADRLRPRTTFSVYRKDHGGVGRASKQGAAGPEDIKGSIEITRVVDAHLSEARVLEEDLYNPMAKGDPIYSPLWNPGAGEAFSVVGILDLDGDGKSDREMFREIVATANAEIDNEVDDEGNLLVNGAVAEEPRPKITERTKFLVKGKMPDLAASADPEEQKVIQKVLDLQRELENQARERGVRIVSLSDFLAFIGYKSQRRLFVPGGDTPYTLKYGSRSASTEEPLGSRKSTGTTSGAYAGDKMLKPKTSGGTTSKLFRGGPRE